MRDRAKETYAAATGAKPPVEPGPTEPPTTGGDGVQLTGATVPGR